MLVDAFSKFIWAKPIRTKDSINVINFLEDKFKPEEVKLFHSDNGGEFVSKEIVQSITIKLKSSLIHGRPRHPQSQGIVERANQTIKERIRSNSPWSEQIPGIIDSYNNSIHSSTKYRPVELEGSYSPPIRLQSFEISIENKREIAASNIRKQAIQMKKNYKNHFVEEMDEGDHVLVAAPRKIGSKSKKQRFIYEGRVEEILETSIKLSWVTKGYLDSHQIGTNSVINIEQIKKIHFQHQEDFPTLYPQIEISEEPMEEVIESNSNILFPQFDIRVSGRKRCPKQFIEYIK